MAKISLTDIASGYNQQAINDNFDSVEQELNDKVLYRDNPEGEPNQMEQQLDMNQKRIINCADAINAGDVPNFGQVQAAGGGAGTAPTGAAESQLQRWDATLGQWVVSSTLLVEKIAGADLTAGKLLYDGRDPFFFDAVLGRHFYIIGDSITSPNGNDGDVSIKYSTDGSGNITSQSIVAAGTGFTKDFLYSVRDPNTEMAWFDITVVGGVMTAIALNRQSAAFAINQTDVPSIQTSDGLESWAYQLFNNDALDAESTVDSMPATSIARPTTLYQFNVQPASVVGDVCIIALGGNDAGGIDIGGGLTAGGAASDVTAAELQARCEAMYTAIQAQGYRVVQVLAAFNDFTEMFTDPTWDEATQLVRDTQELAAAANGNVDTWDFVTTNLTDGLHPDQVGQDYILQGLYPKLVSAANDLVANFESVTSATQIAAGVYPTAATGNIVLKGAFGILSDSEIDITAITGTQDDITLTNKSNAETLTMDYDVESGNEVMWQPDAVSKTTAYVFRTDTTVASEIDVTIQEDGRVSGSPPTTDPDFVTLKYFNDNAAAGTVGEAPNDGETYVRKSEAWVDIEAEEFDLLSSLNYTSPNVDDEPTHGSIVTEFREVVGAPTMRWLPPVNKTTNIAFVVDNTAGSEITVGFLATGQGFGTDPTGPTHFATKSFMEAAITTSEAGPLKPGTGTAASPIYSFIADPDTGMYRVTTNSLGWSTAGVQRMTLSSLGLGMAVPLDMGNQILRSSADPTAGTHIGDRDYNDGRYAIDTITMTAGTGLTGGGNLEANRTFNVIGGDGITANANDIEVDSTVVRTTGAQTIAGAKTFSDNATFSGTIAATGDIGSAQLSPAGPLFANALGIITTTDPSDRRLKKDVETIEDSLTRLCQLRPVQFHFKYDDSEWRHGFIAQEAGEIFPEMSTQDNEGEYVTFNKTELIAHLVDAVQELRAQVEELKRLVSGDDD